MAKTMRRMRQLAVYFTNGQGQVFLLEAEDELYAEEKDIRVRILSKLGEVVDVVIRREAVAYTRLRSYSVEVDDSPKPERQPEPEGWGFRG